MKPLILPLMVLSLTAALGIAEEEDFHTFRDARGRTMRAVIVRTSPKYVWVRRDDNQTYRVPLSTFSDPDREYIANWKRSAALADPEAIEFSVSRYSAGSEREKTRSRKTTIERHGYVVTLKNATTLDLNNLEIEYRIFALRGDVGSMGQDRDREPFAGTARIEELPAQNEAKFKTDAIALTSVSLRSGWVFSSRDTPNSNQRKIRDELGGVWVRVRKDNKIIAEYSTPSTLMEDEPW